MPISKILGKGTQDLFNNISDAGTEGTKITGTTAKRGSTQGQFRFNTTTKFEYYDGTNFKLSKRFTSVNNTNITTTQIDSDFDIVITGTSFSIGDIVKFVGNDGTEYATTTTVTRESSTQITAKNSKFNKCKLPFDVQVTNSSGLQATISMTHLILMVILWTTAAGSLGTLMKALLKVSCYGKKFRSSTVTYSLQSGSLLWCLSLNTTTGVILWNNIMFR